jgi:hypothetical protein
MVGSPMASLGPSPIGGGLFVQQKFRREIVPTLYVLLAVCISNHGDRGAWTVADVYESRAECEAELKNAEAAIKETSAYTVCAKAIVQAKCVRYMPRTP